MTEREQDQLSETRVHILNRSGWMCENCGAQLTSAGFQLAHRIPQRKHLLKKYGKKVIHHPLNMAAVCSEECNAAVSVGNNETEHQRIIEEIERDEIRNAWWES